MRIFICSANEVYFPTFEVATRLLVLLLSENMLFEAPVQMFHKTEFAFCTVFEVPTFFYVI